MCVAKSAVCSDVQYATSAIWLLARSLANGYIACGDVVWRQPSWSLRTLGMTRLRPLSGIGRLTRLKSWLGLVCPKSGNHRILAHIPNPKFVIKVHKDNQSCIAMANNPKFTPRTNHIAIKYHHFRKYAKTPSNKQGFIETVYCSTHEQIADIFTKPTSDDIFWKLHKLLMGW